MRKTLRYAPVTTIIIKMTAVESREKIKHSLINMVQIMMMNSHLVQEYDLMHVCVRLRWHIDLFVLRPKI